MKKIPCLPVVSMSWLVNRFSVDISNASLFWVRHNEDDDSWYLSADPQVLNGNRKVVPTFTLDDILDLFPNYKISTCTGGVTIMIEMVDKKLIKVLGRNPLDAAYQMLCKLLREKLI